MFELNLQTTLLLPIDFQSSCTQAVSKWFYCCHNCCKDNQITCNHHQVWHLPTTVSKNFIYSLSTVYNADIKADMYCDTFWENLYLVATQKKKQGFLGNDVKHWWCDSMAITLCIQHLLHNNTLNQN